MDYARNRCLTTRPDIRGGASDGASGRQAAEQWRRNVGDAPAASRQGNALAGLDASLQFEVLQGSGDGSGDVLDARAVEVLANANDGGLWHGFRLSVWQGGQGTW